MKTAVEIRSEFLNFFKDRQHHIVPSAPVVLHDDPTLFFTNAGMNQFKDVFLGTGSRSYKRAADTQKCLRVSGKHNDLEVVGRDTYHHTLFEMLGNWSFGDYFKKEAIVWAWELLTGVYKIPKEVIWITIFGGDKDENLAADEEAGELWIKEAGVASDRILRFGKKDNFWEMGDTGPCGPCSEIHIDRGPDACNKKDVPNHHCSVNGDCCRYIEIWNLVFIQFNRQEDKKLLTLPAKHVDTGMGLERLVALLQGKLSNYDTDLFQPLIAKIAELSGKQYTAGNSLADIAFRVIADHVRAVSCAFADSALPDNNGSGYVLRRLLRRAVRFGLQGLGQDKPFIYSLVPTVAELYQGVFPEVKERQEHIALVIKGEEESFLRTLEKGIRLFNELVADVKKQGSTVIPGDKAYQLYQQDGFPRDLVDLMATEQNLTIDEPGWQAAEVKHKEVSQGMNTDYQVAQSELEGLPATRFVGYARLDCNSRLLKLIGTDKLVLERTPFYAEMGGQVADTGAICGKSFRFNVTDTQKFGDIYVHFGNLAEGDAKQLPVFVTAYVDKERRRKIMANHTATHLLHYALRLILGKHAVQQGSSVSPERLRFDFAHPQKVTREELEKIELLVNARIADNIPVRKTIDSLERAKQQGVTALFGEKYGEEVRVVSVGHYSKELCGGTHVYATGDIGYFQIVSESSVQTGVRRIEAITRGTAVLYAQEQRRIVEEIRAQLKAQDEKTLSAKLTALLEEVKQLKKDENRKAQRDQGLYRDELLEKAPLAGDVKIVVTQVESMNANELRTLADVFKKAAVANAGLLASVCDGKVFLVSFVADKLADNTKLHAGEWMQLAITFVGGGGNTKRKDFAQGQGPDVSQLDKMLPTIAQKIREQLL